METTQFDQAVNCIINGRLDELAQLLEKHPSLVHQKSYADHQAQLIHYLGANGIEDHLQLSPKNAPEIAKLLISKGADPNAPALIYGNDSYVLDLVASSVHPYLSGVQEDLISVLVKGGAKVNGSNNNGSPIGLALGFGYTATAERLAEVGAEISNVLYAAGLGKLELIRSSLGDPNFLKYQCNSGDRVGAFTWPPPCLDDPYIMPFIYAAFHDRISVIMYFIEMGIDPNVTTGMGQTALHFAAYKGYSELVHLLVEMGANPKVEEDQWQSVPAGWALQNGFPKLSKFLLEVS